MPGGYPTTTGEGAVGRQPGRRGEARSGKEPAAQRDGLLQQQLQFLEFLTLSHKPGRRKMPLETGLTRPRAGG